MGIAIFAQFNNNLCIVCQTQERKCCTTSTDYETEKMQCAANQRKDGVFQSLAPLENQSEVFQYRVNSCYKG